MKIYFAASIRAGREDAELYQQIIEFLKSFGNVLTEHIGDKNLSSAGEDGPNDEFIHNRDMKWLLEADIIVAEVTTPSLGVGYEIGRAIENNKPVLCIYNPNKVERLSAMISGNEEIRVEQFKNIEEAKNKIENFLVEIKKAGSHTASPLKPPLE